MAYADALARVAEIEAQLASLANAVPPAAGQAGTPFSAVLARAQSASASPSAGVAGGMPVASAAGAQATSAASVLPGLSPYSDAASSGAVSGIGAVPTPSLPTLDEPIYPLGQRGTLIGKPYEGTHTLGNWESDNAVDIGIPTGTPVYAVADGVIGSQIGPLDSTASNLAGQRVHLETGSNEYYYAHLSQLTVTAGQHVRKGDLIGYSGSANGVDHLHFAVKVGSPVPIVS